MAKIYKYIAFVRDVSSTKGISTTQSFMTLSDLRTSWVTATCKPLQNTAVLYQCD